MKLVLAVNDTNRYQEFDNGNNCSVPYLNMTGQSTSDLLPCGRLLQECCSHGAYTGVELVDDDSAADDILQRFTDMQLDDIGER